MIYVIVILFFLAVFLLLYSVLPEPEEFNLSKRLKVGAPDISVKNLSKLSGNLTKSIENKISGIKWPSVEKLRKEINSLLNQAGNPANMTADGFITASIISAFVFMVSVFIFFHVRNSLFIIFFGLFGWTFPKYILKAQVTKRHRQIQRALPDVLDLVTLSMEAGIDFNSAVNKVIAKSDSNALIEELFLMQQGMRMGQGRKQALTDMAVRVSLAELTAVVSAIVQAEQLGASLSPVLRTQASEMRVKRFQLAESMAQKAPVKLLFPLLFFIMPAIFIIIFGPIAIQVLSGGLKF